MKVRPGVDVAGLSDIGCKRENNEDCFAYWEPEDDITFQRLGRLAIVADGMGGAEGGQFASRISVESARDVYSTVGDEDPQERLLIAFREANQQVQQEARQKPALHGMGTTLTACAIVANQLYYAHIGDSRAFLIRGGDARQLTRDHSLVARLVESCAIRPEDAENHPQKHVLTAAVGIGEDLQPDFPNEPITLQSGDAVMICTDGLWGQMSPAEIAEIVSTKDATDACQALVQLARKRGGPDNITLQVLRVA
jgi:PPM family protein phosphatase